MNTKLFKKKIPVIVFSLIATAGLAGFVFWLNSDNTVVIKQSDISSKGTSGKITSGVNNSEKQNHLSTTSRLVYESPQIITENTDTNAVIMSWQQSDAAQSIKTEVRAYDGKKWSDWYDATADIDERPDSAPSTQRGAFIAGQDMSKIQYRMTVQAASQDTPSTDVDLNTMKIDTISAKARPDQELKTALKSTLGKLGLISQTAQARTTGPSVISRAEWGCPEPNSSEWTPEYAKLNRVIIHHTAVIPGTDSMAAVRSIWQYHAKNLGWGDIGYNYLFDQSGRIFEGRLNDKAYAEQNNVDVIGGHAYGNNEGTVGLSALGDFNKMPPTSALVQSMGEMAAYKMGVYGLNPAGGETYGGNLLGHRDVGSTSCPGQNLYDNLQTIRNVASAMYPRYHIQQYAWQYMNQYAYSDNASTKQMDLNNTSVLPGEKYYLSVHSKNTGTQPWVKDQADVRLGTSRQNDRISKFCTNKWISCGRTSTISEPTVLPSQIGSFIFPVIIPDMGNLTDIVHKEYFSPLAEGKMWMNDPGLYWQFNIPAIYKWQYVTQAAYLDEQHTQPVNLNETNVVAGQKIYLTVTAKNTGSRAWQSKGSEVVRLGTSNRYDRTSQFCDTTSWVSCARAANVDHVTAPGETGTFNFSVVVPANTTHKVATVKEYFRPLSEGVVWMNDPGLYWQFSISPK